MWYGVAGKIWSNEFVCEEVQRAICRSIRLGRILIRNIARLILMSNTMRNGGK